MRVSTPQLLALINTIREAAALLSYDERTVRCLMDQTILHRWLKAGYLERHAFHPTIAGTPQGGPISPVLANLTLDGLERLLAERYPKQTRAGKRTKVNFVRFADDFIVTGSSKELLEHEVKPLITAFLAERGLELSAEKTHTTHINDGFDFLGQNVRKYHGKLLITPSNTTTRVRFSPHQNAVALSP